MQPSRRRRSGSVLTRQSAPDRRGAEAAVRALLKALGFDPDDPALCETPSHLVSVWLDRLTTGYEADLAHVVARGYPSRMGGTVLATQIPLVFTCPHHLLVATGQAHLAFVPGGQVPGLSSLFRLVDALSRRLVLQEDLTHDVARALEERVRAKAAVVSITARHTCVAAADVAHADTSVETRSFFGAIREVRSLEAQIDATLGARWKTSDSGADSPPASSSRSPLRRKRAIAPSKRTRSS